ncbi:ABC transporter permease [Desulfobacterales bacterium HSG16]|nr:ABC transporter permease [Desulfobacterales bacterium HSG16]
MKTFFMIGWRNLWRNKRRSLVVISSVALGIFAMLFSMGFMNGMNRQMVENTISTSLGHVSIHYKGFLDDMKLEKSFVPSTSLLDRLESIQGLAFAPRVKMEGMIRSSEASRGVMIIGIDPEREKSVTKIFDYTKKNEKSAYLSDPGRHDILISQTLAEKLDLLTGDKLVLMVKGHDKEIVGMAFRIKGLFQSPLDSFDKFVVFTGITALQEIVGIKDRISEIVIRTPHRDLVDEIAVRIKTFIKTPGVTAMTWKEMAPGLMKAVILFDNMMYIFFAIIFTTVVFSIANTLIMAIMERFREIGVMKSIGTRPSWIGAMVMFESINLGIAGMIAGILMTMIVVIPLSFSGIDFSFYAESMRDWGTGNVIYPVMKTRDLIVCGIIVLTTTIAAAIYPAIKAARIKPLDALHHV